MDKKVNREAIKLIREIDFVDRDTLELKKEIQYKGCPFCNLDDGEFIENYQTTQALFYKFKKCNNCLLIYPYPRPNKYIFENYFKTDEHANESEEIFRDFDKKDEIRREKERHNPFLLRTASNMWRNSPLCYSYQEFKRYAKRGDKILDVGAGPGVVARQLLEKGCIVEAVEVDPYRAKYLRGRLGIKVYEGTFAEAQLQQSVYDMIIFSQVLMHLFSIKENIQKIRYALRPGGLMISSQMNFNSIIQQTIRSPYPGKGLTAFTLSSWFTPESLKKILVKSDFEIMDIMFRPSGLFGYVFPDGYPGGRLTKFILKSMDQLLKIILMKTGTSDYFAVIAKKVEGKT